MIMHYTLPLLAVLYAWFLGMKQRNTGAPTRLCICVCALVCGYSHVNMRLETLNVSNHEYLEQ
jgi:hypothetical protein